jgi:hypothetical protein
MNVKIIAAFGALALAACGVSKETSAAAPAVGDDAEAAAESEAGAAIDAEREHVDLNAAHPELAPELKIGGAEGRSPFVGDRVVGLNAIVRRSLEVSREFDAAAGLRAAAAGGDRAAAQQALATVSDLHDRAKAALNDMLGAEKELKASGEYYDEVIFAGMMKFVADVETETREEKAALAAKLG